MSKIWNKILEHIFLYDLLYLGINILLSVILYIFNVRLRLWVYTIIVIVFVIGLLISLFKLFKMKKIFASIILAFLVLLGFTVGPFLFIILAFSYCPEHVVELEGDKYVAVVNSFLDVDVYYYDYYGPFFMGTKLRVHGDFGKGGFDPIDNPDKVKKVVYSFYDKYGNVEATREDIIDKHLIKEEITTTTKKVEIKEEDKLKIEDAEVLYEIKFDNVIKRFVIVDYALGQNYLVMVIESKDGGKTFNWVTKGAIQVSGKPKFIFLDENMGFANKTQYIYFNNPGMYVTNDGGETFELCEFKYKSDKTDHLTLDGEPYIEDGKLKLKCREYLSNEVYNELIFVSKDKGKTWELEK